jgi:hypothetical protein
MDPLDPEYLKSLSKKAHDVWEIRQNQLIADAKKKRDERTRRLLL